jgi:NADH-quinone oxidoreductase subunit C
MNLERVIDKFPGVVLDPKSGALIVPVDHAVDVACFLKSDPDFWLDYASNVTGVDFLPVEIKEKKKDSEGKDVEVVTNRPGYFEVVYHLYSMAKKHGPVVLKQRTKDRENCVVASLTPVYRGAELQEREIYDLFGVQFRGHPDLRRILMWDGFVDYPMRKDYKEPDDYEYEPTPHAEILEKARAHYPAQS